MIKHTILRLITALGGVVMVLCVLFFLLVPKADDEVSKRLSEATGQHIVVHGGHMRWSLSGPRIRYEWATVQNTALSQPELAISWRGLVQGRRPLALHLSDLHLSLERNGDMGWTVLGATQSQSKAKLQLALPVDLVLHNANLSLQDSEQGWAYALAKLQLFAHQDGQAVAVSGHSALGSTAEGLKFEATVSERNLKLHANFATAPLALVSRKLEGVARGDLWLDWGDQSGLRFSGQIDQLGLSLAKVKFGFDRFDGQFQFEQQDEQLQFKTNASICQYQQCFDTGAAQLVYQPQGAWHLSVPNFNLHSGRDAQQSTLQLGADFQHVDISGFDTQVQRASGGFNLILKTDQGKVNANGILDSQDGDLLLRGDQLKARLGEAQAEASKFEARYALAQSRVALLPTPLDFEGHRVLAKGDWQPKAGAALSLSIESQPVQAVLSDARKALGPEHKLDKLFAWLASHIDSDNATLDMRLIPKQPLSIKVQSPSVGLSYHPLWPSVEVEGLSLRYARGGDLAMRATRVRSGGLVSEDIRAYSADLKRHRLDVNAALRSDLASAKSFLAQTPLWPKLQSTLNALALETDGGAAVDLALDLPLKKGLAPTRYAIDVALADAALRLLGPKMQFSDITGHVLIDDGTLSAPKLDFKYLEQPARAALLVDQDQLQVKGASNAAMQALLKQWLPSMAKGVAGRADLDFDFKAPIARGQSSVDDFDLSIKSGLQGITRAWPKPYSKQNAAASRDEHWLITRRQGQLAITEQSANRSLQVDEVAADRWQGEVRCGQIDPLAWASYMQADSSTSQLGLKLEINCKSAALGAWQIPDPVITLNSAAQTDIRFSAQGLDGSARRAASGEIEVVLAQLNNQLWHKIPDVSGDVQAPWSRWPTLKLRANTLVLGAVSMQNAYFDAVPDQGRWLIRTLGAQLPGAVLAGSGQVSGGAEPYTSLSLSAQVGDADQLGQALGYGQALQGSGQIKSQLGFLGLPWQATLAQLDGALGVELKDGRVNDVQTGVGSLLPLLALQRIPNILRGQIDTSGQHFDFETLSGQFRMNTGLAITDSLVIKGPVALIEMQGSTDLNSKATDHQLLVIPQISDTIPLVGLIAAGPIGGLGGFIAEQVLEKAGLNLDQVAGRQYRITGTVDHPVVN